MVHYISRCPALSKINTMKKYIAAFILTFFMMAAVLAQTSQQPLPAWKFHSINQLGLLNGQNHTATHLQSVNGFQHKNLYAGIGIGLDYYQYRSVPVFAALRKYFGKAKNQFFVYADGGINFVWEKKEDRYTTPSKYYPQFYSNAGFGYQLPFKNGTAFTLSAGYSYKKVKYKQDIYPFCPFDGPCYMYTQNYNFDFNRLILQIGLMF